MRWVAPTEKDTAIQASEEKFTGSEPAPRQCATQSC